MALFGRRRDIGLFISMNRELLQDILEIEIDYYQLSLQDTTSSEGIENLYGEASAQKTYFNPVRIACLIEKQDEISIGDEHFGTDREQQVTFKFLNDILVEQELVPQIGDIIESRGNYYEVDGLVQNQFILGKDNRYAKSAGPDFGESLATLAQAHWTRPSKLQIYDTRA